jgi:hypothetical protein
MYQPILRYRRYRRVKLGEYAAECTLRLQLIWQTEAHGVAQFPPHVVVPVSEPRSSPHSAPGQYGVLEGAEPAFRLPAPPSRYKFAACWQNELLDRRIS